MLISTACLPAVDDAPATMPDALALCRAQVKDGITTLIATPHQLGRFDNCNEAVQIREAISVLNEELKNNCIASFERISIGLGEKIARLVCIENPLRVLKGRDIETVSLYKHKEM